MVEATLSNDQNPKLLDVACPEGKGLIGGGVTTDTPNAVIERSGPVSGNGWRVRMRLDPPSGEIWTLGVSAFCATLLP